MRTIEWDDDLAQLRIIDQRLLPAKLKVIVLSDHNQVVEAIRSMAVRGAPAIGVTAAFGMALAAINSAIKISPELFVYMNNVGQQLIDTRPTAVNLNWAVNRILKLVEDKQSVTQLSANELKTMVINEAKRMAEEDIKINQHMARHGADLIEDGDIIIHHCNTGALAAVDWGTALGVIRMAHEMGKRLHVLVDETRPRLQGARLTAWELQQYGISYEIITDNAAGFFLQRREVNKVFFGADRIAANGDVANKIGTYMLALAAQDNKTPVYCVAPTSSIDLSLAEGRAIPIEERPPEEVLDLQIDSETVFPASATARNPAFDITPNHLLTAIVTEIGVVFPPFKGKLFEMTQESTALFDNKKG